MSQPRLLVEAGPSLDQLQVHAVNSGSATEIKGPHFEGRVAVRIEQYLGPSAHEGQRSSPYFAAREGDMTWSIAVEGRFLEETTADDVRALSCLGAAERVDRSNLATPGRNPSRRRSRTARLRGSSSCR